MGRQESPRPRQRHRVPHHRRRPHDDHHHRPAAQTTNGKSAWSLGRLNRECHAPDSDKVVENWLGQVTAPVPTSWLVSPEAQNQSIHHEEQQRSHDKHIFSCSQNPRRVDPAWRPQHIPPAQGSSPPRFPLPTNRNTKLKHYKQSNDDSSLISDPRPHRELRELGYIETNPEHDEGSHHRPLDGTEVGTAGASSPPSHKSIPPTFEKRPRHKTKTDKYDTKKLEDRKRKGEEEHRPRKSKSNKKGPIVAGKNVMKNFTSQAVLNDRITVQANMKPGLFNNKRVPKEHLITDLSFSEMPFPARREHDVPQQKGLSNSRRSERQRESQELERISSFFLPARANATLHKERPGKIKYSEEAKNEKLYDRDHTTSGFYQTSFTTPSSPTYLENHRQQSSISWESPYLKHNATPSKSDCRPSSSRTTTYFTWPSTQDSPRTRQYADNAQLGSTEPTRSPTPENIRQALIATRVYEGTGIYSHGLSTDQQNNALKTHGESSPTRSNIIHRVKTYEGGDGIMDPMCSDSAGDIAALPAHLEARWNSILPPEWRLRRSSDAEIFLADQQPAAVAPGIATTSPGTPNRQGIGKQAGIKPMRDLYPNQYTNHRRDHYSRTSSHSTAISPTAVDHIINNASLPDESRATISSRDAMPPPPIPLNSLHFGSREPGDDCNSPIRLESARLLGTNSKLPNHEHMQIMDAISATSRPRESSAEPEKVIPMLDSASWIPQAVTSGITNYERDKTLSRLSMRSPIYGIHGKDKDPQWNSTVTLAPPTHMTESITDFILRIESELEESTSIDERSQQEPIMLESPEFPWEAAVGYSEAQDRQLMTFEGQIDHRELGIGVADLGPREMAEMNHRFHEYEASAVAPVRDRSTIMFTECPRDDTDDFLEMSNFWRPNRFSQF